MSTAVEILAFLGGCLFYAVRGSIGKLLLSLLIKLAKLLFRFTTHEAELYSQHKQAAATKRSTNIPGR